MNLKILEKKPAEKDGENDIKNSSPVIQIKTKDAESTKKHVIYEYKDGKLCDKIDEKGNQVETEFDDIKIEDTHSIQSRYAYANTKVVGEGFTVKTPWFNQKKSRPTLNPPVLVPEINNVESEQEELPDAEKEKEERKREYRSNIVTSEDLRAPTPAVVKNKNRQGFGRYIFLKELRACKNGFLYYIIPLVIGAVLLIYNMYKHDFWTNAVVALLALCAILCLRRVVKNVTRIGVVIGQTFLLILLILTFILLMRYVDGFKDGIYIPFMLKILMIAFDIFYCLKFYACFALVYAGDCMTDFANCVTVNAGGPGCGKTSDAVHEARIIALKFWEKLQYDYWSWHSREEEILKRNNKSELLLYHEIKISYNFYIMRPCIPCLFSNSTIEDRNGNRSHQLELGHLRGILRLPLYTVAFIDEIGAILKAELSNDKERPYDVSDMFRLGRHFLKWCVIACEQDFNNIYIDCRRVVGFNRLMTGQEWVCRPGLLYGVLKTIKFLIIDGLDKKQKRKPKLSNFMMKFEKFVYSIGYRKYNLQYVSNTQTKATVTGGTSEQQSLTLGKRKSRYVPSMLAALYDDRAYRELYPSYYDKEIKGELHPARHIIGTNKKYGRQFVNTSKGIDEKRDAVDGSIQEIA